MREGHHRTLSSLHFDNRIQSFIRCVPLAVTSVCCIRPNFAETQTLTASGLRLYDIQGTQILSYLELSTRLLVLFTGSLRNVLCIWFLPIRLRVGLYYAQERLGCDKDLVVE
jgi:hypothetical protein